MPNFRLKPQLVDAVELTWSNWNEVCDVAGVGVLREGKPEGCYIGADGYPVSEGATSEEIGLAYPTPQGVGIARQGDWVVRYASGIVAYLKPDIFEATYEPAERAEGSVK